MKVPSFLSEAVLYQDYRDGSFEDLSNNGNDGTPTSVSFTNNGLATHSGGNVVVSDSSELQVTEGCLIVHSPQLNSQTLGQIISKRDGGGTNYDLYVQSNTPKFYDGATISNGAAGVSGKKMLSVNFRSGEKPEFYYDGIFSTLGSQSATITVNDSDIYLGSFYNATNNFESVATSYLVFPRKLTASELAELYGYLESLHFDTKVKSIVNADLKVQKQPLAADGTELVANGGFDTDTDWTKGDGWTIGSGIASKIATGGNTSINQVGQGTVVGKSYICTYTVSNYSAGTAQVLCGGATLGALRSANGTYSEVLTAAGSDTIGVLGSSGFIGSIDNVSIQAYTGLVAGYNMKPEGGVLVDQSENGNDMIKQSGDSSYSPTLLGDAIYLNEDGEYQAESNSTDEVDCTISLWMNLNNISSSQYAINKYESLNNGWGLWITAGNVRILDDIDNTGITYYDTPLSIGINHHVVATLDGKTLEQKLYLDGELVGSGEFAADTVASINGKWNIGSRNAGTSIIKDGKISHVRVHNETKDQDWVATEYNKGKQALFKTSGGAYESVANQTEQLENTPFKVDSGAFKITRDSIDGIAVGVELMTDGDMEAAGTGAYNVGNSAVLTKDTTDPHSGTQALRIAYGGASFPNAKQGIMTVGKKYRVRGWARGNGSYYPYVVTLSPTTVHWQGTTSTSWQYFDFELTTTDSNIRLYGIMTGAGYVEFDDVSVQEVTKPVKVIECITAGRCYIPVSEFKQTPTEGAYGTWEFWFNQDQSGTSNVDFISDDEVGAASDNGYQFRSNASGGVSLYRWTAASGTQIMATASGVITAGVWHKIKITRTPEGEFTVYVDDVAVTATTGTNPVTDNNHTISLFFKPVLAVGDKISYGNKGKYSINKYLTT